MPKCPRRKLQSFQKNWGGNEEMLPPSDSQIRAACDSCHARKIRCTMSIRNRCRSCHENDRVCKFSPRLTMGRPRNWHNHDTFPPVAGRTSETSRNHGYMSYNETRDISRFGNNFWCFFQGEYWILEVIFYPLSRSPASSNSMFLLYLGDDLNPDHHVPLDFQLDNGRNDDHVLPSLGPPEESDIMSTRDHNTNLKCFAKLSELHFDLHHQREGLLVTGGLAVESLAEVPGLDLILRTIDAIREFVDGFMCREEFQPEYRSGQPAAETLPCLSGLKMLTLTTARESLGLHQILVNIASKSKFPKPAITGDLPTSPRTKSLSSARFVLGSFATSDRINQILVFTMIHLHVISFNMFLHSLSDQAIGGGVTASVLDAKATVRQIQLNLMVILEVSKADGASFFDSK